MKKYLHKLRVTENKRLNNQYFLIKLTSDQEFPQMYPAQFAEVKVENAANTFLRRPLSVHYVDRENNELHFLIEIKGEGTKTLSELKKGDLLDTLYPLGNTWTLPPKANKILLIGGGCGVAPLLYTAKVFSDKGCEVTTLIGGYSDQNLLRKKEYAKFGEIYTITEDGSHGEKGLVTEHSLIKRLTDFDAVFSCGPEAMMKAVAELAIKNNVFCEVSLEKNMACGIGACLVCVEETIQGNKRVCVDGPVFNVNELKW